jgi:hypothetical protein
MVIMSVYDSQANVIGRCDSRCYDAQELVCECVCFGKLHGLGLSAAIAQAKKHGERWVTRYAADKNAGDNFDAEILEVPRRQTAFFS